MIRVHLENGRVEVRRGAKPRRAPGHALLRLIAGGICNTDIELLRGYYGFHGTPGHEFVAEVSESANPKLLGKRIVGDINLSCGHCDWCRRGLGRHCPGRAVLGIVRHPGAFQEFFTLPEANLHVVPANVATEHAVFTEPLAAALEILDQVKIPRGERVAVLGDGKLGLLIAQALQLHGAEVHLYGRHKEKMRLVAPLGVTAHAADKLPRSAYNYAVDATGSSHGLATAASVTRPRGTVVLKSTVHDAVALDMAPIIVNELTLVGSRCGRFAPALKLLASNRLKLDGMIDSEYPLADAPRAFDRAQERGVLKVLLRR